MCESKDTVDLADDPAMTVRERLARAEGHLAGAALLCERVMALRPEQRESAVKTIAWHLQRARTLLKGVER